jgi:phosphate transport system permease protein
VVETVDGKLHHAVIGGGGLEVRSRFAPMLGEREVRPRAFDFVFGDVSIVAGGADGANRVFSLYRKPGAADREFGLTKTFRPFPGGIEFFAASQRNKLFLVGGDRAASIRHATTEAVRWEANNLPFPVKLGAFGPKNDMIFLLDGDSRLHAYSVRDPHPEASWKALFGKVWYEGYAGPIYAWQSTGGSDEFEPKLSLVPLLFGTIKGTFYAMLFAVPIALLAALYTSQFLAPSWKATVKPVMEVMASLPSVVLGFMAALWLAPILGPRIPSLLAMVVLIPVAAVFFGAIWGRLPRAVRRVVPDGYEFALFLPVLLGVAWVGWGLGPVLERSLFSVVDPATGHPMADFRLWWNRVMQLGYDQRNALVVGFAMGFAVIPIIFTIAEDSLSNVPRTLVSGSLALGASRWQTALNVVLPTASPGIFSALMIGLGRAVGETMIVVMATGNTPIMEWNLFSGMRTLSANIAVELPEAPVGGTLYRTLFLGAMLLFLLTFAINTLAEVLRQRLREKYKTV